MLAQAIRLGVVGLVVIFASAFVPGCDSDESAQNNSSSPGASPASHGGTTPPELRRLGVGKFSGCPTSLTGKETPSTCKLLFTGAELASCDHRFPGGYDVRVLGIPCLQARDLQVPLGCDFPNYAGVQARMCRPSLVLGPRSEGATTEPTGWTCWSGFDPEDPAGIRNVCWRGSDLLVFNVG
jgi:hypothetical protein